MKEWKRTAPPIFLLNHRGYFCLSSRHKEADDDSLAPRTDRLNVFLDPESPPPVPEDSFLPRRHSDGGRTGAGCSRCGLEASQWELPEDFSGFQDTNAGLSHTHGVSPFREKPGTASILKSGPKCVSKHFHSPFSPDRLPGPGASFLPDSDVGP